MFFRLRLAWMRLPPRIEPRHIAGRFIGVIRCAFFKESRYAFFPACLTRVENRKRVNPMRFNWMGCCCISVHHLPTQGDSDRAVLGYSACDRIRALEERLARLYMIGEASFLEF